MLRLSAVLAAGSVLSSLLGDCGRPDRPVPAVMVPAHCDVGGRPGYFVPSSGVPPKLLGCARLGVSGRRVEFSRDRTRIDGEVHLCINPAYSRGRFIPTICTLHPPPSRFRVHDASQPRQAVRGYEYVIWGTAPAGTAAVTARARSAVARAAVFDVPPSATGASFAVFVLELPLSAACGEVTLTAPGTEAVDRVAARRTACARGQRLRNGTS